ncbi:hypothetical protein [Scytonema sp. PRP1]
MLLHDASLLICDCHLDRRGDRHAPEEQFVRRKSATLVMVSVEGDYPGCK